MLYFIWFRRLISWRHFAQYPTCWDTPIISIMNSWAVAKNIFCGVTVTFDSNQLIRARTDNPKINASSHSYRWCTHLNGTHEMLYVFVFCVILCCILISAFVVVVYRNSHIWHSQKFEVASGPPFRIMFYIWTFLWLICLMTLIVSWAVGTDKHLWVNCDWL